MKRTTLLSALALGAIAALSLSACTAEETSNTDGGGSGDGTKTVWYADVMDSNPIIVAIAQGLNATLAENDIKLIRSFSVDTTTGAVDVSLQTQALTRAVESNPSAIGYFVLDPAAARPQIEEAMGKDIPVFAAFGQPAFDVNAYIALYDEDQGYVSAKYLAENLPKGAKVAVIGGGSGAPNLAAQEKGVFRALEEAGVQVVGDIEQQRNMTDDAKGGQTIMQSILQQNPDVQGVYAYNDDTAIGAIAAAKQAGADITFVSRNGSQDAIAAIKAGDLLGTCDIEPVKLGQLLGQAMADQINGSKSFTGSEQIDSPKADECMVTADNVDSWKSPEELVEYVDIPLG